MMNMESVRSKLGLLFSQNLINNILSAYFIKGGAIIVGVLTVRVYMTYFSTLAILGVWYTILSVLSWILNFDFGIGNGLRNLLSEALVKNDREKIKRLISSGYIIIGVVTAVLLIFGCAIAFLVNWNKFFNILPEDLSRDVLTNAMLFSFIGIVSQLFFKLITSVLNAMERTAVPNVLTLITNIIITLFAFLFKSDNDASNLLNISITYLIAVNVPYIIASIFVFSNKLGYALPRMCYFETRLARKIVSLGGKFFWVQIMLMMVTITNEIFITWIYGTEAVVSYQVYNKLFYTMLILFSLISSPIWSSVSKAWHENRIEWIRKTFRRMNFLALGWSTGVILLCTIMQQIVNIWLGPSAINIEWIYSLCFAAYTIIMLFTYALSAIANGVSHLSTQILCFTISAALKYPLCLVLSIWIHGWNAIILANAIIMIPYVLFQPLILHRILIVKSNPKENKENHAHV